MSDAGYTLAEMLTALAMIGLALGGMTAGVGLLGKGQRAVNDVAIQMQAERAAEAALGRLLQARGPYRSIDPDRLQGAPSSILVDCGEAAPCRVDLIDDDRGLGLRIARSDETKVLPLRVEGPAQFRFQGSSSADRAWPPNDPRRQVLRSVAVVRPDPTGTSILNVRLWKEQAGDCAFDVVIQDCR